MTRYLRDRALRLTLVLGNYLILEKQNNELYLSELIL